MLGMPFPLLALWHASLCPVFAIQAPGLFVNGGGTLVSAMMAFLANEDKVYILDKVEGNPFQINGHPAWSSVWDFHTHKAVATEMETNTFCSSGIHLPNGSFATFGGTAAVGKNGIVSTSPYSADYGDYDGSKSIRIVDPCTSSDDLKGGRCQWFDNSSALSMQRKRWYASAEPLADGTIVLIGGFVSGGYVNRNVPNVDPRTEGGAAEPSYEFFPSRGEPKDMKFMVTTSGLNAYAHAFLMPSGKMFVQANYSTILWDYNANVEFPLPDMPRQIVRVYPASGAVAMLPLTPSNNYTPTIIFCGGSELPAYAYGNYTGPAVNTWEYSASKDCQRITPEPLDGSPPVYEQDDEMLSTRTMGQFIILPDGKLLVINGAQNGAAGYAQGTGQTPFDLMPYGMSLAASPVFLPHLYDPNAPRGKRWSTAKFSASNIPRMYHSTAVLLPDASVFVAGSNPNIDVNLTTHFSTTYKAEIFYPHYFQATTRPVAFGVPKTVSYGGDPFDITIPASSYSGSSNDAVASAIVSIIRPGFSTHAMNMGQRYLQLNNTHTVHPNGSITLHVSQVPPNPNLVQPGPAFLFVVVNGVPSNGAYVIVGSGNMGPQPTFPVAALPTNMRVDTASGTANPNTRIGETFLVVISSIAAGIFLIILLICCAWNRRRKTALYESYLGWNSAAVEATTARAGTVRKPGRDYASVRPPEPKYRSMPYAAHRNYGRSSRAIPREGYVRPHVPR